MSNQVTFAQRPAVTPTIYAYALPDVPTHKGYLKVGYTERNVEERVREQLHTSGVRYQIVLRESAMRSDGSCFTDHEVHTLLRRRFRQLATGQGRNEWFACSVNDVRAAVVAVRRGSANLENRSQTFKMRPEQVRAVQMTMDFYASAARDDPGRAPKFLWNAKMRFGKPQPQKEKPAIDLSKIVPGAVVTHPKFGQGTIVKLDKQMKYLRVTFDVGEKVFVCPTVFEQGFLKL